MLTDIMAQHPKERVAPASEQEHKEALSWETLGDGCRERKERGGDISSFLPENCLLVMC